MNIKKILLTFGICTLFFIGVYAATFVINSQADFDEGIYNNTFYNTSGFVQLYGNNITGNYTSRIFDANGHSSWNTISWTQGAPYQQELPNNNGNDGYVDMANNVLLLHMNEASGTIVDYSEEGNNGSYNGALYSQIGKLNTAIGFDGTNDRINCGNDASLNLRTTLTVSAWINLDTTTPAHGYHSTIVGDTGNSNWWFYVGNNAKLGFLRFKGTWDAITSDSNIPVGQWVHVVITYNNSATNESRLYINGQLDKEGSLDGPIDALGTALWIGDRGSTHRLKGKIDELVIWNVTLSASEVLDIYKRGALKLNLTVRSCDDDACSSESWIDVNDTPPQNLSITDNQYFQYKMYFSTPDSSVSPKLYNATIDYSILNSAPSTTLILPQQGNTYGYNESIELNFSVSDPDGTGDIDSCWYNVDDGQNITIPNCQNTTFNVSGSGSYTLNIFVNDTQNIIASDSVDFSVQLEAPTIELYSPINIYLNYQNVTFSYKATDFNLDTCELWSDFTGTFQFNQSNSTIISGQPSYFYLNLSDNSYIWNVKCNDSTGNFAWNGNKTFDVDTIAPQISLSEPSGSESSRTVTANWSISDINLDSCWYNVYRGINIEKSNTSVNCSADSTTFSVTVDADFIFNFYANDSAGNLNSSSSSFTVDTSSKKTSSSTSETGTSGGSYIITGRSNCTPDWICGDWGSCTEKEYRTRYCYDRNKCNTDKDAPAMVEECVYANCTNYIKDPGEEGIDCGGPCPPCSLSEKLAGGAVATTPFAPINPVYALPVVLLIIILIILFGEKGHILKKHKKILTAFHAVLLSLIVFFIMMMFIEISELPVQEVTIGIAVISAIGIISFAIYRILNKKIKTKKRKR